MNNSKQPFFPIPLTHLLILTTISTAITIIATIEQHMLLLMSCYLIGIGHVIYKKTTSHLIILLCMITSSLLITARINYQYASYKSDQSFLKNQATIQGTVEQINHSSLIKNQSTIFIATNLISTKKNTLKKSKKICVFLPTDHAQQIQESDFITFFEIQLEQPTKENDYQRYLVKEGIWAIAHGTKYTRYSTKKSAPSLQQKILSSFYQKIHHNAISLFDPLFLGKKEKNITNLNIQHQSAYWGIAHHMARSGAHLAILFTLIMLLLHYTQFAYIYRYTLCVFLLVAYACISQSSISFLRALFMILLHISTKIFRRIPSSLHTITLTTLLVLFYNPMQLFFLDFQLSFGITYIIIWLFNIKNSKTIAFYKRCLVRF